MKSLIPKVLISAPTSDRHKHLLDEWIESLDKLTYKFFDVLLIDTSKDDSYSKILKKKKVHGKKIRVIRMSWNEKNHIIRHLANVRERIRKEFLKGDYSNLFFLDTDIFIPKNSIQLLLTDYKDNVGFAVPIFYSPNQKPCIFKSGNIIMGKGLDLFEFDEINAYKNFIEEIEMKTLSDYEKGLIPFVIKDLNKPYLFKPYAVNIGCILIKREVLEEVPFRTHPTFLFGEDLWYFSECNDKHFEFWCDTRVYPIHKNVSWDKIQEKCNPFNFKVISGPTDAKEAVVVKDEVFEDTETKVFEDTETKVFEDTETKVFEIDN